jgi:hypothetical protein
MKEYQSHIDIYSKYSAAAVGTDRYGDNWGNKQEAEAYLEKYWMPASEYDSHWHAIQNKVFVSDGFPEELIFAPKYELMAFRGGCLFTQDDFEMLRRCLNKTGDEYLFVVENAASDEKEPPFRMRFPADIDWWEITSGNFISAMIVDFFNKDFFVFGDTACWGQYATVRYLWPLNLIGFLPECSGIFLAEFKDPGTGYRATSKWIPPAYRDRIRPFEDSNP